MVESMLLLLGMVVGLTVGVIAGLTLSIVRPGKNELSLETLDHLLIGLLLLAAFAFGVLTTWLLLQAGV
jgi:hypothetical protein